MCNAAGIEPIITTTSQVHTPYRVSSRLCLCPPLPPSPSLFCLSVCLSVCLPACLSVCLPVGLTTTSQDQVPRHTGP